MQSSASPSIPAPIPTLLSGPFPLPVRGQANESNACPGVAQQHFTMSLMDELLAAATWQLHSKILNCLYLIMTKLHFLLLCLLFLCFLRVLRQTDANWSHPTPSSSYAENGMSCRCHSHKWHRVSASSPPSYPHVENGWFFLLSDEASKQTRPPLAAPHMALMLAMEEACRGWAHRHSQWWKAATILVTTKSNEGRSKYSSSQVISAS